MKAMRRRLGRVEGAAAVKYPVRSDLVGEESVRAVVELGCQAHAEPHEFGLLTCREWLTRFTWDELLVIEQAAQ